MQSQSAANSQEELHSDYNQFLQGSDPNARIGLWNDEPFDLLADWQVGASQDAASTEGDPLFIDRNGADNRLGYDPLNELDGGADDNFHLSKGSPAIDSGDSVSFPATDFEGNVRRDDLGTVNSGRLTYHEAAAAGVILQSAMIGSAQNWRDYNTAYSLDLPFAFPLGDASFSTVQVSTAGFLHFAGPDDPNGASASFESLAANRRIAPLWSDWFYSEPGDDIYIDESVAGQVTIVWDTSGANGDDLRFAATLFADGRVRMDYEGGEVNSPTIGLSRGDGAAYLGSYHERSTLVGATPRVFTYGPSFVDRGVYEFQGSSLDDTPPVVVGTELRVIDGQSPRTEIYVRFSEAVDPIDARATANYELIEAGPNGLLGDGDDRIIAVRPRYEPGTTLVVLEVLPTGTVLSSGRYQLIVHGDSTIHDLAGLRLDGDGDQEEGGNFVGANRSPVMSPIANIVVDEGQAIDFVVSASDPDSDTLRFELGVDAPAGMTLDPSTGRFQWTSSESQAPAMYAITIRVFDDGQPSLEATRTFYHYSSRGKRSADRRSGRESHGSRRRAGVDHDPCDRS
jgi:hypothetical protein